MKRILLLTIAYSCSFVLAQAQITPAIASSSDIYQQIKKLNVLGNVLYIAAHPDDENNGLLPFLAKEKLYRTAYLSLTRGDGGQNLIGPEQGVELGMIRTQELLAARAIDGSEQYFTRAYEFGFSKSSEEALQVWDKEEVLKDVVWLIRSLQPDIIIARFPGDARAGHGHHSASAIIANEAYEAAADPSRFPEQFKYGLKPWKAKRILWNTFNFGRTNTISNDQLKIEVGGFNPLLGKSYGELGGEARSMHKSQAEGRPRRRGEVFEYFTTTGGDTARTDIMEGVDVGWSRLKFDTLVKVVSNGKTVEKRLSNAATVDSIQRMITNILKTYDFRKPDQSVPALVALYQKISGLSTTEITWKTQKLKELQDIIEYASGLFMEAYTQQETALKGDSVRVNYFINKRSNAAIEVRSIQWANGGDTVFRQQTETNKNYQYTKVLVPETGVEMTQPYWLRKTRNSEGMFVVEDQYDIGKSWNDPLFHATFIVNIEGVSFRFKKQVMYKYVDAERGELYQPFIIVPHIELYMNPGIALLNVKDEKGRNRSDSMLHVVYRSNFTRDDVVTTLNLRQDVTKPVFSTGKMSFTKGQRQMIDIPISKVYNASSPVKYLEATMSIVSPEGKTLNFSDYFKSIRYEHIPNIHYTFRVHVKVVDDEIKVKGKKIGFIAGSGDGMPDALRQMGYEVKELTDVDVTDDNLKQYDAIITGLRAYNLHEWLTGKYDVMMRYIQNGGNLIVQYNRNQGGVVAPKVGPYPFQISTTRVTEESAEVRFTLPAHPVLNTPNKITDKDFNDWIQERSTYQADQVDGKYEAPLSMNDTGEKPSTGSLIIGKYGKGNFAYVSLVMFRQLPAGNPGSFKLLANLIALPKHE